MIVAVMSGVLEVKVGEAFSKEFCMGSLYMVFGGEER